MGKIDLLQDIQIKKAKAEDEATAGGDAAAPEASGTK